MSDREKGGAVDIVHGRKNDDGTEDLHFMGLVKISSNHSLVEQSLYIPKHLAEVIVLLADVCISEGQYCGDHQEELFGYIAEAYPDLIESMWWYS